MQYRERWGRLSNLRLYLIVFNSLVQTHSTWIWGHDRKFVVSWDYKVKIDFFNRDKNWGNVHVLSFILCKVCLLSFQSHYYCFYTTEWGYISIDILFGCKRVSLGSLCGFLGKKTHQKLKIPSYVFILSSIKFSWSCRRKTNKFLVILKLKQERIIFFTIMFCIE